MNILLPHTIATKIANSIVVHDQKLVTKKDEIRYGLEWLIAGLNQIMLILMLSIPFNLFLEAIVVMLAGASLRMFSGGAHFKGYYPCLLFSTVQIMLIASFSKYYVAETDVLLYLLVGTLCVSFVLTWFKTPFLMKKKHQFTETQKQHARKKSIIVFLMLFLLSITILKDTSFMYGIWLALIAQSLTLTKTSKKLFAFV